MPTSPASTSSTKPETFANRAAIEIISRHSERIQCSSRAGMRCTRYTRHPARPSITARLARLRMEPSLVKEVFGTDHAQLTTGDAYWASQTKVWFVLIKDTKGRYPGNPLWGDGWGWALFKSDAPDKQVAVDYRKGCLGCHVPAKATDWIYVQG